MNPKIPNLLLAQEGSISGHSNINLVKSELFSLSVVMGKASHSSDFTRIALD